jgi:cold shock CspA family protein
MEMTNMERRTGKLNVWFGNKGYGFIICENPYEKFFLHVSKMSSGQPAVDAAITFSIMPQREGKFRSAIDAVVEGLAVRQ